MRTSSKGFGLSVIGLGLLLMIAPEAVSHTRQVKAGVTLGFTNEEASPIEIPVLIPDDPDYFSGTVTSANAKCEAKRTVIVLKKTGKKALDYIGKATTAANGTWRVEIEDPGSGSYIAVVRKLVLARETDTDEEDAETVHRHVCRSKQSKVVEATDG